MTERDQRVIRDFANDLWYLLGQEFEIRWMYVDRTFGEIPKVYMRCIDCGEFYMASQMSENEYGYRVCWRGCDEQAAYREYCRQREAEREAVRETNRDFEYQPALSDWVSVDAVPVVFEMTVEQEAEIAAWDALLREAGRR